MYFQYGKEWDHNFSVEWTLSRKNGAKFVSKYGTMHSLSITVGRYHHPLETLNMWFPNNSYVFPSRHVWIWELDHKEDWVPKNWCFQSVVLEKALENPLDCKEIQPVHPKGNQSWIYFGRTDAEAEAPVVLLPDISEEPTHWKRPWCWQRLKAGGEGVDRGWDGWMASSTQWTWVWADSKRWWRTGKPGVLQSMALQSRTRLSN